MLNLGVVFTFGVADHHIMVGGQHDIADLTFCSKRLTGAGFAQDQTIGRVQPCTDRHDDVIGQGVQTVIQCARTTVKKLLCDERHEHSRFRCGHGSLDLHPVHTQRQRGNEAFLLLIIQRDDLAQLFLGNALRLINHRFQPLAVIASMQKREGHQEQTLCMAGQAFQQLRQTVHIAVHFSGQDVDVITGADSLLLLVDFAAVDIGQLPLHQLNGFHMVKGLDMHGDHLRGLHTQEIHQYTVIQLRRQDIHEAHGSHLLADHELVAILEVQTARRNEILGGQAGGREPLPVEQERRLGFIHVHHAVHELQTFLAIQRFSLYSQPFQMIQQLQFDLFQPGLCCTDAFSLDGESDVLAALQGIVAFRHLTQQHG